MSGRGLKCAANRMKPKHRSGLKRRLMINQYQYTWIASCKDNTNLIWRDLSKEDFIKGFSTPIIASNKLDLPAFIPVRFGGSKETPKGITYRHKSLVKEVYAMVADIDNITQAVLDEFVFPHINQLEFFAYSTFSATVDKPKVRIILPLTEPIVYNETEWEWQRLGFHRWLGCFGDPTTKDPGRIFFMPGCPNKKAAEKFEWLFHEGRRLTLQDFSLSDTQRKIIRAITSMDTAADPTLRVAWDDVVYGTGVLATEGERHNRWLQLTGLLYHNQAIGMLSTEDLRDLFNPTLLHMYYLGNQKDVLTPGYFESEILAAYEGVGKLCSTKTAFTTIPKYTDDEVMSMAQQRGFSNIDDFLRSRSIILHYPEGHTVYIAHPDPDVFYKAVPDTNCDTWLDEYLDRIPGCSTQHTSPKGASTY
jgi:hypothetical protein